MTNAGPTPNAAIARPASGRPDDPGAVEHRRVERDGVADVLAPDELDRERLADRHVDGVGDPEQEGQHQDHPDLDDAGDDEHGEDRGEDHHRDLGRDQDPALGQGVRGDAGEQAEDHDRDELGGRDDAEPDRIVGQLEDEPRLGDLLHPGPDQRDRLAGEEQPVVAMAGRRSSPRSRRGGAGQRVAADHDRLRAVGSGAADCALGMRRRAAVELGEVARRGARARARASSIIVARRAALASRISIWRSARAARSTMSARRSVGIAGLAEALAVALARGVVLEQLADLGEREPGVVAQAADELRGARGRRRRTGGSRRPTAPPARAGRSPRSSGSRGSSGRSRRRPR